jgi:ribonuclease HI
MALATGILRRRTPCHIQSPLSDPTYRHSEPARQAIKTACILLETGWQISTVWIPSHSDILGNELADKMAKKGAENDGNECSGSFTVTFVILYFLFLVNNSFIYL